MRIERYLEKETPEEANTYDAIDALIMKRAYSLALTLVIRHERLMKPDMFRQYRDGLAEEISKTCNIHTDERRLKQNGN